MKRILEQIYTGDLCPAENKHFDNPQYRAMCSDSLEEIEAFSAGLSKEARENFDRMMEHYLELCFVEKTQAFSDGFRVGARVMCEVFCSESRQNA